MKAKNAQPAKAAPAAKAKPAAKAAPKATRAAASPSPASPASTLGLQLRHARLVAGYTLLQLSQKAGCSESLISKLERGHATPSFAMLHRLAVALDTNIAALTSDEAPGENPILRRGERSVIKAGGIALERLVLPKRGGLLQANIHIVSPGESSDGQIEHVGEEVGYVLEGVLELMLGDVTYTIGAGDAFTFPSSVPHGYRNIGTDVAKVLWVNSPATF
ncbi:helix-turn-helix domain-containing protein [Cupriavidus sp. WS]|uniref:helix-turn-helix domain-containing protein n=1 Tax=Cupriavidus sp. WS TaxID=1312922 RepID=UPI00037AE166|nr:XRE family transcriptional regulator [Cupriavidus sp. WS]